MLSQLLHPRSIAVIGASSTKGKVGNMIAKNLLAHGFSGDVFFVNPNRKKILGKKSYVSLAEIGKQIDCTIVVVPANFVETVIDQSADYCKNYVVISAGFGESGADGHNREVRLNALAQRKNLHVLGPNCLGFSVPSLGLNASFAEGLPMEGAVAFISQSGALAVAMMDRAEQDHVGFSAVVSIGNKMHIGATELIEYFTNDHKTHVIALYLEGVIRGRRFLDALAVAHKKGKKVIILKSGRSDDAKKAIALHTGSLAGSDEVFTAALEKVGAMRVITMDDLFGSVLLGAHMQKDLKSEIRFAVVTNAGGPGVLATDAIAQMDGVKMSDLRTQTKHALQMKLPKAASVHNPIDILGDADIDRYKESLSLVLDDDHVDAVLILLTPQDQTPVDAVVKLLIEQQNKKSKILIASFIGGRRVEKAISTLRKNGILHFASPYSAVRAVAQFSKSGRVYAVKNSVLDADRRKKTRKILEKITNRSSLYFEESVKIAEIYGINIAPFIDVTKGIAAHMRIKYPCVVKVDNPYIIHKTDQGGVIAPVKTLAELDRAQKTLIKRFQQNDSRVIVQPFFRVKMELIIGMTRDAIFGPVVVAGLGGIYAEVFSAVDHYIAPVTKSEIKDKLKKGSLSFLFDGTRGEEVYNINMIADVIYTVAAIGQENPEIRGVDINPFFVYNDDTADIAVDFKIII